VLATVSESPTATEVASDLWEANQQAYKVAQPQVGEQVAGSSAVLLLH
jgi:hypothetical protein